MSEVRSTRPVFFLSSWHVAWSVDIILYSSIFIQMHFIWMLLLYQCFNDHDSDQHIVQILIFMSLERIWYGIMGYMIDVTLLRYFSLLYPYLHLSMWNMISWIYYFSARLCTEYFPPAQVAGDIRISQEAAQPGHLPLKSDRLLLRLCTTFQLLPQFYQFNSPTIKSVTSWKS